jgi:adenylate kinase
VLRSTEGIHQKVGLDVFVRINPKGVILLEAATEIIAERLLNRGDTTWSYSEIELLVQAEFEHADFVCRHLGIPLVRLFSPSEQMVLEKILNIFS